MFKKLNNTQKQVLSFIFATVTISIIFGGYYLYSTDNLKKLPLNQPEPVAKNNEAVERGRIALEKIKNTVQNASPEKLLFSEVTIEQLNVYPKSWVKNNFTKLQQDNELISGSSGDPDGDDISNLKEFLYGSNPNSAYTFCGGEKTDTCDRNDKQMIDNNQSPLTGLPLEIPKTFKIKKIDQKIIEGLKDSFGTASSKGMDFPKLYEQSRTINLDSEMEKITISTQKNERETILKYYEKRLEILKDFSDESELSTFTNIYKLLDINKIKELQDKYKDMLLKLQNLPVPEYFTNYHKASIIILQKLIVITDHRIEIIKNNTFEKPEEIEKSQKQAKELLWGYRKIASEQIKISSLQSN